MLPTQELTTFFLKGIFVGFAICVPVGPIAILIMRRTVVEGRIAGFVSGLGAATADAIVGILGAFFLALIVPILDAHNTAVQFVGGGIVLSMGVFLLCTPPKVKEVNRPLRERNLLMAYFSTCALTLSNPLPLLGMPALMTATGMGGPNTDYASAAMLVAGIFAAATAWWIFICTCANWLARMLGNGFLRTINLVAAILVIIGGVWLIAKQANEKLHLYERYLQFEKPPTTPNPPGDAP